MNTMECPKCSHEHEPSYSHEDADKRRNVKAASARAPDESLAVLAEVWPAWLRRLRDSREELEQIERAIRMMPVPDIDRMYPINAIQALLQTSSC